MKIIRGIKLIWVLQRDWPTKPVFYCPQELKPIFTLQNKAIMTEGNKAWLIPDNKREEFMNSVDELLEAIGPRQASDLGYNWYSDPIVKFENFDVLSAQNQKFFAFKMKQIGAKEVTEIYDL